jgi:hypothetical protein
LPNPFARNGNPTLRDERNRDDALQSSDMRVALTQ